MTVFKKKKLKLICHDYEIIIIIGNNNFLNLYVCIYVVFQLVSFLYLHIFFKLIIESIIKIIEIIKII